MGTDHCQFKLKFWLINKFVKYLKLVQIIHTGLIWIMIEYYGNNTEWIHIQIKRKNHYKIIETLYIKFIKNFTKTANFQNVKHLVQATVTKKQKFFLWTRILVRVRSFSILELLSRKIFVIPQCSKGHQSEKFRNKTVLIKFWPLLAIKSHTLSSKSISNINRDYNSNNIDNSSHSN